MSVKSWRARGPARIPHPQNGGAIGNHHEWYSPHACPLDFWTLAALMTPVSPGTWHLVRWETLIEPVSHPPEHEPENEKSQGDMYPNDVALCVLAWCVGSCQPPYGC